MTYRNLNTADDARYGRYIETTGEGDLLTVFKRWLEKDQGGSLSDFNAFIGTCGVSLGDVATEEEAWELMKVWYDDPERGFEVLAGLSAWP